MHRNRPDLLLAGAVALLAVALALLHVNSVALRTLLGLPLVLFIPGYLFTALFLRRELALVERLLLSFGISLGFAVISGLVLNITPWGITTDSWALWMGGWTFAGIAYGMRRPAAPRETSLPPLHMPVWQAGLLVLAVLIAGAALSVTRTNALDQQTTTFTQLWMLPAQTNASAVQLGVENMETTTTTYSLRLQNGSTVLHEWPALELAPGQTWQATQDLPATRVTTDSLEALLYRADAPTTVYRRVELKPSEWTVQTGQSSTNTHEGR